MLSSFFILESIKEKQFQDTIDDGIKIMLKFHNDDIIPQFFYCFNDYYSYSTEELEILVLARMKTYGLKSSILTGLDMWRLNLITKEKSKAAYEQKLKNDKNWRHYEVSINDDLESFFNKLQAISSLKDIKGEGVKSFFLPKISEDELKLIEQKNRDYMLTYYERFDADVEKEEMKKSDSADKYICSKCYRRTMILNLNDTLSKT